MWLPLSNLEAYNKALVGLEQKLLALFRKGYPLEDLLASEDLLTLLQLVDENPYQAVLIARVKSSHAMTPRHAINVMLLARAWAVTKHKLGSRLEDFTKAALCHDLGHWEDPSLIYVFDHFTHQQFRDLKKHTLLNDETKTLLGEPAMTWIAQHHEQPDGKGYPEGLQDSQLELLSQALRLVDCFEGLTTARRFRPRYTPQEALEIMKRWAGTRIHAGLFNSFKKFLGQYPVGTFVILNEGGRGVMLPPQPNGMPVVLQLLSAEGDPLDEPEPACVEWRDIQAESPSWHRPELPEEWLHVRPDLLDLPRAY